MKMIIILSLFLFTVFDSSAQSFEIGTKESFKRYKSELKAPDFLDILKKSKQPTKKDFIEIITFNGFSDLNTQRCSFDVHTFRKSTYKYENEQFEYLDSVQSVNYIYQNQKIVYKEVWLKSNGRFRSAYEVHYYKNGKPKSFYSYIIRTKWLFDKDGNIIDEEDFQYSDIPIVFDFNKYKFNEEEESKIRKELMKIALNFEDANGFEVNRSIRDWKVLNITKEYLKKLFRTEVDLYYDGMSDNFVSFYSEYGKFYTIENGRVFELGVYNNE